MRLSERTVLVVVGLFLLALPPLVHSLSPIAPALSQAARQKPATAKREPPPPSIHYGTEGLPGPVQDMRDALLAAVQSGRIEELRQAYDLNDLKPDLGAAVSGDPVAHWKKVSGDGEGREVLAALSLILEAGYVVLPLGRDLENNKLYIWPYFAEVSLDKLSPAQEVELLRLVPPASARHMQERGSYSHWRLTIGADGAWHSFRRGD
ncbi:MAG: hypothetical protein K2X43_13710 [Hyphomonadaceae bacterium]|jgi:hypothetical protein|nr:hypothetical protein [Hyphomonadaceae bacterium]